MNKRELNIEKRRRKILKTAARLVAKHGPEGLTMRSLGKAAGFSVTTLYNLFGNKDDILTALLENALNHVTPDLHAKSRKDPFSALLEITTEPVNYLIENAGVLRPIMAVEYFKAERRSGPYANALFTEILNLLSEMAAAAQKEGYLAKTVPPVFVAAEIFYCYRLAVEDWGLREISDQALLTRLESGVLFILLSVATDKSRSRIQTKLKNVQGRAVDDLFIRYPGLGKHHREPEKGAQ